MSVSDDNTDLNIYRCNLRVFVPASNFKGPVPIPESKNLWIADCNGGGISGGHVALKAAVLEPYVIPIDLHIVPCLTMNEGRYNQHKKPLETRSRISRNIQQVTFAVSIPNVWGTID